MLDILADRNKQGSIPFLARFISTGLFFGYSPVFPGTVGSLVGIAIYAIPGMEVTLTLSIVTTVTLVIGIIASAQMEKHLGDDPQVVVIDEIVGMWISLILVPKTILVSLIAFSFFRLYDIVKPQPARYAESFKHGWGIMLDDVVAGIYANISVRILLELFPKIV